MMFAMTLHFTFRRLLTCMLLLSIAALAYPQHTALRIGDKVPDIVLRKLYNHSADSLSFSDLRGKLVILDFWSTGCVPCLKAFPKVDSLQKEYAADLQLLAVAMHDYDHTAHFFATRPFVTRPDIPFVTGDSILHRLFPHVGVPFHVWIAPDGTVLQFSDGYNLSRQNIGTVLATGTATFRQAVDVDYRQTLFDSLFMDDVLWSSYLVRYDSRKNLRLEGMFDERYFTTSGYITQLFQYAYQHFGELTFDPTGTGRVIVDAEDKSPFFKPPGLSGEANLDWVDKHLYFYQTTIPSNSGKMSLSRILDDFRRYFSVVSAVEEQEVKYQALVRTTTVDKMATKGGTPERSFGQKDIRSPLLPRERKFINQSFADFSTMFGGYVEFVSGQPYVDETGYSGRVDIVFDGAALDDLSIQGLQQALAPYGLGLIERTSTMPVLVLRKTTGNQ